MLFFPCDYNSLWCFRITGCEQDDDSSEYEVSFTYISFINLIIIHLDVLFGNEQTVIDLVILCRTSRNFILLILNSF